MSLEDLGFTPDPEAPPDRRRHRRRGAWVWSFGGLGACAVAAVAVMLIISGWGYTPAPAPMPPHDFSVPAASVPDPVTGPVPQIGQAPLQTSTDPVAGTTTGHDSQGKNTAGSDDTTKAQSAPTPRQQVPTAPLSDNRLVVPAVGVDAHVGTSSIVDGELVLPGDVKDTTEWDGSAPIRGDKGTILVAGHVNNVDQGEGALWQLHLLQSGDAVYLARDGVVTRWKITGVQAVHKANLPKSLFVGDHGPRLLKLVTCGGKLMHDPHGGGYYQDNVIATAVPF